MRRYKELEKKYEELSKKYDKLWGEKEELSYELNKKLSREQYFHEQSDEIRVLHENVRRLKHDMKNHMLVLATYLGEKDYLAARTYVSSIVDKLNAIHSYIETDNSLMNYILNQKLELARKKGIVIKAEIENLGFERMESMDFTAVLSNLLDNAIEACEKEADKELHVLISQKRGYEVVVVKNKVSKSVLKNNPNLISDKKDKSGHGLGVKQIRNTVEKYEGIFDFYEENHFFCACAFIPK